MTTARKGSLLERITKTANAPSTEGSINAGVEPADASASTVRGLANGAASDITIETTPNPNGIGEHVDNVRDGEEAQMANNSTIPDQGRIVGTNETKDPESVLEEDTKTIMKAASALQNTAMQIAQVDTGALANVFSKTASAGYTENANTLICKLASEGDPMAQDYIQFSNLLNKIATGEIEMPEETSAPVAEEVPMEGGESLPPEIEELLAALAEYLASQGIDINTLSEEEIAMYLESMIAEMQGAQGMEDMPKTASDEAAELEAEAEEVAQEIAVSLMQQDPSISPEDAKEAADSVVAEGIQALMSGEVDMSNMEQPTDVLDEVDELVGATAEALIEQNPGIGVEEAIVLASDGVEALLEEVAVGEEMDATEAVNVEDEMTAGVAGDILAEDPSIDPMEATAVANEAVEDAANVAADQDALVEKTASGAYVVSDVAAVKCINEMLKTASANPLRDTLTPRIAQHFGVDTQAFSARVEDLVNRFGGN